MEVKILNSTEEAKAFLNQDGKSKETHTLKPEQLAALSEGKWLAWQSKCGGLHLIGAEGKVDEDGLNG